MDRPHPLQTVNPRYTAPELINNYDFPVTAHSDTYSFALLILECVTEAPPFSNINPDAGLIHARISKQLSPYRPEGSIPDELWELMNRCWVIVPEQRPSMDYVHRFFLSAPQVVTEHTYGTAGSIGYDPSNPEHRRRSSRKYLGITGEAQLDIFIPILFKVAVSLFLSDPRS